MLRNANVNGCSPQLFRREPSGLHLRAQECGKRQSRNRRSGRRNQHVTVWEYERRLGIALSRIVLRFTLFDMTP
jgi:hypothetical protein